jgi:hypothetical protein
MPGSKKLLPLVLLLGLATACTSGASSTGSPRLVTDTLGNAFDASCSGALCTLTPRDGDIVAKSCSGGGGSDAFVLALDPLLAIYAWRVSPTGSVQIDGAAPSRPLACTSDADCLAPGISTDAVTFSYACANGLCRCTSAACTSPDGNLFTYDVLTLCQADLPWPTSCPYLTSRPFADRIVEVASVCGAKDTCATVPASCRQLASPAVSPIDGGGESGAAAPGVDAGS